MTPQEIAQAMSQPTVDLVTAGRILGIGRSAAYRAGASGDIPCVRVGKKMIVMTAKLRSMLNAPASEISEPSPATKATAPNKRMGRPLKSDDDRRSAMLRLRARRKVRQKLEEAASNSGCTLSAECERRLEMSFLFDDLPGIIRSEVERAFAREAVMRGLPSSMDIPLPNMSDADRADWLTN